jgi:hypothetical protein
VRIRQIKPAFWTDAKIASLPPGTRLFYIGLWMLADDGGWLRWDVDEIGAELYPFDSRRVRERRIERYREELNGLSERLLVFDCGHAYLPHLVEHQRFGGHPTYTIRNAHELDPRGVATNREKSPGRVGLGRVEVGEGTGGDEPTTGSLSIDGLRAMIDDPKTSPAARRAFEKALSKMEAS